MAYEIRLNDCVKVLQQYDFEKKIDVSFIDPPFNQNKEYNHHKDNMPHQDYWRWMKDVSQLIYNRTSDGGTIYFMQREKNTEFVLQTLRETQWQFQNLIIWKKKTSAVPSNTRYGKHFQIIAFATKGKTPRVFNKLRINPPLLVTEKYQRVNGMYVTDVWDDIRELTSGYLAGDEPIRLPDKSRAHKQQSPIALLIRIILTSSLPGDMIFDPFAGTGTTLVVAEQLKRKSLGVEIDPFNVEIIKKRLSHMRPSDRVERFKSDYRFTDKLEYIWQGISESSKDNKYKIDEFKQLRILADRRSSA